MRTAFFRKTPSNPHKYPLRDIKKNFPRTLSLHSSFWSIETFIKWWYFVDGPSVLCHWITRRPWCKACDVLCDVFWCFTRPLDPTPLGQVLVNDTNMFQDDLSVGNRQFGKKGGGKKGRMFKGECPPFFIRLTCRSVDLFCFQNVFSIFWEFYIIDEDPDNCTENIAVIQ